jgi:hypothetical protein
MQTIDLAPHRLADMRAADEAVGALRRAASAAGAAEAPLRDALTAFARTTGQAADFHAIAAVSAPAFVALIPDWIKELRTIAAVHPDSGACTVATGLQLWLWTMKHFKDAEQAPVIMPEMAAAFGPLFAARCRILEVTAPGATGAANDVSTDLCHAYGAHAAATAGAACAELVFGYRRHLAWDAEGCSTCFRADELDELEGFMPGIGSSARAYGEVIEADGSHAAKAGPCAKTDGVETFARLRARLDGCLTGARRAKERAAAALAG